jgi:hypothetical protein
MQAVRSIAPDAAEAPAFCGSFIQQDRLSPASESRPTTALPPAPSPGPTQRGSGPVLDSSRSLCPHQDQARDQWCTIWCKTKCNKLSNPLQCSSSQPHSPLHGMQGVSGSNPLGSILKAQAWPGFFNALVHDLVHGSLSLHSSVFQRAGFTRRRTRSTGRCSSSSSPCFSCTGAKGVRGSSSPTHPHRCLPWPFCGQ